MHIHLYVCIHTYIYLQIFSIFGLIYFFIYVHAPCACSARRNQKRERDPLKLEIQVVMTQILTKSSASVQNTINNGAIFPGPYFKFLKLPLNDKTIKQKGHVSQLFVTVANTRNCLKVERWFWLTV